MLYKIKDLCRDYMKLFTDCTERKELFFMKDKIDCTYCEYYSFILDYKKFSTRSHLEHFCRDDNRTINKIYLLFRRIPRWCPKKIRERKK